MESMRGLYLMLHFCATEEVIHLESYKEKTAFGNISKQNLPRQAVATEGSDNSESVNNVSLASSKS
jgi:hypothetical protein